MEITMMILQLLVVLMALYVGSRYGSLALGAISGIGLAILVFGFGLKPGNPPTDVIYIIIAAVTCAGIMQASGGMDWLIQIAERLLRKHPKYITILAPLCTFFLTVLVGTGHVVYTLMPIICDISLKKGIRPERPCGVASIASQVGITCSPIAAAVASFVIISNENGFGVNNLGVIAITIPACICGLMAAAAWSYNRGLDLDKDPQFQARLADPKMKEYMSGSTASVLDKEVSSHAKAAVYIFLGALAVIVLFSVMQIAEHDIRPEYNGKPLGMNIIIQIVMIAAAALMILFCKAEPKKAVAGPVWQSGMVAVVAIYGITWLADTYFSN
jgi:anaerobic C4-dicarboxylate transporter DcuB